MITQGDIFLALVVGIITCLFFGIGWAILAAVLSPLIALVFWFIAAAVWPESE